mmetsp:Transcript_10096/g.19034  ORF Transcript_10096/g.19034 Transcript_10096/m.19034 type:complete len:246 (+) Transcript_10096:166-903(+)
MAYSSERWSRGCGTGIGLSSAKNQYRLGVTIDNWVEEDCALQEDAFQGKTGTLWTTPGVPPLHQTTHQTSFTSQGTFGPQIMVDADRKDLQATDATQFYHKFAHGMDPAVYKNLEHFGSLNSLTFCTPAADKTKVQANLFHGSKFNDHTVPQNVGTGELVAARKKRLEEEKASSVYTTTNKLYFGKSAEQAKEIFETTGKLVKSDLVLPTAEGGQRAQIGRKAKGDCSESFDMEHKKTGLRKEFP